MRATLGYLTALVLLLLVEWAARTRVAQLRAYDERRTNPLFVKSELYAGRPRPDLCFLGTSRTENAFRSEWFAGGRIYGVPIEQVFNYGVYYGLTNRWLTVRDILSSGKPPKVVVYETTPCEFTGRYENPLFAFLPLQDGLRYVSLERKPEHAWAWATGWLDHSVLERVSMTYRYRQALEYYVHERLYRAARRLRPPAAGVPEKSWKVALRVRPDGYGGDRTSTATLVDLMAEPGFRRSYLSCEEFRMDRTQIRLFEDSVDSLLAAGSRVVLLDVPVSRVMEQANYTPEMRQAYASYLARFAHTRRIPYLTPGREECGVRTDDFWDLGHLNVSGARKFSACVKRSLSALADGGDGGGPIALRAGPAEAAR